MDGRPGLLEREAELTALHHVIRALSRGHGGLALVEGPAGIGKTQLLKAAQAAADDAGARTLWARGTELERDFAFGAVRQLFESWLFRAGPSEQRALWQGPAARIREIIVDPGSRPTGDLAVLHGLFWLTVNGSRDRPLVLIVDDLQWCDAPTVRFLAYLLPRIEDLGVLILAALRTGEQPADERLLREITANPAATVLRPAPLSEPAAENLVRDSLRAPVDRPFALACHHVTGGNPLLIRELIRTIIRRGLAPTAENAARVDRLRPEALTGLVARRLDRLPRPAVELARAVAVLGGRSALATAAALTGQDPSAAIDAAAVLERREIIRGEPGEHVLSSVGFVHPLVQSAVYESVEPGERASAHRRAGRILGAAGADPEQVAAHLLRVPSADDPWEVETLRAAAGAANLRGAPRAAVGYLRHCVVAAQPAIGPDERVRLYFELGTIAQRVDLSLATRYLQETMRLSADPVMRGRAARTLGNVLSFQGRSTTALGILAEALEQLPTREEDLRRRLEAEITWIGLMEPDARSTTARTALVRDLPDLGGVGDRALDSVIAYHDALRGDPGAVGRAGRAVSGTLAEQPDSAHLIAAAWNVLIAADHERAVPVLNAAIANAHTSGSLATLAPATNFRGLAWLCRGQLAEAETDLRESMRTEEIIQLDFGRAFSGPTLADVLMEGGRLDEAESILATVPDPETIHAPGYHLLDSRARLLRLQGRMSEALDAALAAGRLFSGQHGRNPAFVAWRTEAALALHALGRADEAVPVLSDDLRLAREWGAPRALGRALRVSGLITGGDDGLDLLRESVAVLKDSPARLEYAKALADLGSALRRGGRRFDARPPLRQALDIATRCGADPLADYIRTELAAAGGRPRRAELTGPGSLTPSEYRVADLASQGATNRQIAQQLFVTPKTVEVHLSAAYRKLGITARTQLPAAMVS
jgi:DNA-binding CsgD family transcriptional regulator